MTPQSRRTLFLASIIVAGLAGGTVLWALLSRAIARLPVAQTPAQELAAAQLAYDRQERPRGVRGQQFFQLCYDLDDQFRGTSMTEDQVVRRLGTPDRIVGPWPNSSRPRSLLYYWNRDGEKDWLALVSFDNKGALMCIAYNSVEAIRDWGEPPSPYTRPTSAPASLPATSPD